LLKTIQFQSFDNNNFLKKENRLINQNKKKEHILPSCKVV